MTEGRSKARGVDAAENRVRSRIARKAQLEEQGLNTNPTGVKGPTRLWDASEWVMVGSLAKPDAWHVIPRRAVPDLRDAAAFLGRVASLEVRSPYLRLGGDGAIRFGDGTAVETITRRQAVGLAHEMSRLMGRPFQ